MTTNKGIMVLIRRIATYFIVLFFLTLCLSIRSSTAGKINVFVSISPQKYFAEAIGDGLIQTTVVVSPAHSPADYEPAPAQMVQMAKADIYFAIGVPFESAWLEKFAAVNPRMRIVHTDAGIDKKPIDRYEIIEQHDAGTGEEAQHRHQGMLDPHIWLSPPLVKVQAGHMLSALVAVDPLNKAQYRQNYAKFITRIDAFDKKLRTLFSDHTSRKQFLVFHPSWGYFADAYGLTQISIEIEGKSPKAREVRNLIEFAQNRQINLIFVQPQFSTKQAEIIANEINGQLIYADPLAEDWFTNLQRVAASIKQALN